MSESSNQAEPRYAVGVDYGTNSVRALVADCRDGCEVAAAVFDYPTGEAGVIVDAKDPNLARQNPADYVAGFDASVAGAVKAAAEVDPEFSPERVVGLGVDTTGSTPIPVDKDGTPLAMHEQFRDNPGAQAWLWKDHTAHAEAAEITEKAEQHPDGYLRKCGGTYSSEWYWSKILRCRRAYPEVFEAAYAWVELCDFVPGWVTGNLDPHTMARSVCAAGHKAMYHPEWGGLPSEDFLASLDPALVPLRGRYASEALACDRKTGGLTEAVAEATGLRAGLPVAVGAFDAHHGAVGSGVGPGTLVKIMGTSTCDIMVAPGSQELADIPGVCGIVPGSVVPGMFGIEAGQSAVGDLFNWAVSHFTPAKYGEGGEAHQKLTEEAEQLAPGASGLLALDWNNGNRTVLVDPRLGGLLVGQTLHTTAAEHYRALIEATAFGALAIIQRIEEYGVAVESVIACGGIAEKNPMAMQIYADVCDRPMRVSRASQTCALGAAIFGAVVGGAHPDTSAAQAAMTGALDREYRPDPAAVATYRKL